jgi:hypothetical protein
MQRFLFRLLGTLRLGFVIPALLTPQLILAEPRSADAPPARIEVAGTVQLWTRSCRSIDACDLPVAVGPAHPVQSEILQPASRPGLAQAASEVVEGPWRVQLGYFWRQVGHDVATGDYVTFQVRVSRQNGDVYEFITECSFYDRVPVVPWLATGSCSGMIPGSMDRVGVTFQKAPQNRP